jgi:peroxiredoxin (alkyl hydroperoxide reductase subunit C)
MTILVGRKAPDFTAPAILPSGEISEELNFSKKRDGKYAIIVFYPLDFTFVCPSELIALNKRADRFNTLNVEVFSVSIDSQYTHLAWRNTPINKGGIGHVDYNMVADVNHSIVKAYGVESPNIGVAFRGTFLIDKKGYVRHQIVNDLPLGRDMDELIRVVEALQFVEAHGEVCPAGWHKGNEGMEASPQGVSDYLTKNDAGLKHFFIKKMKLCLKK